MYQRHFEYGTAQRTNKKESDNVKEVEKGEVNVWRKRVIVSPRTALTSDCHSHADL